MQLATISSKRQLTLPVKLTRKLGIAENTKVWISEQDGGLLIKPTADITTLGGSLQKYAKKGLELKEIIKKEYKAIDKARMDHYVAKTKREKNQKLGTW